MVYKLILTDSHGRVVDETRGKYGVQFTRGISEAVPKNVADRIWANIGNVERLSMEAFQERKGDLHFQPSSPQAREAGAKGEPVFPDGEGSTPDTGEGEEEGRFDPPVSELTGLNVRQLNPDFSEVTPPDDYDVRMRVIRAAEEEFGYPYAEIADANPPSQVASILYWHLVAEWLPSGDVDVEAFLDAATPDEETGDEANEAGDKADDADEPEEADGAGEAEEPEEADTESEPDDFEKEEESALDESDEASTDDTDPEETDPEETEGDGEEDDA